MLPLLVIIPGILTILEKIAIPLLTSHTVPLINSLTSVLTSNPTVGGVIGAIEGVIGSITDDKRLELQGQISTLLAQAQTNIEDAKSEHLIQYGWRPFLAWGLGINIVLHATLVSIIDILEIFGYNPFMIAPIDAVTLTLMSSLLGIYMAARTVEKYSDNS